MIYAIAGGTRMGVFQLNETQLDRLIKQVVEAARKRLEVLCK